MTDESKKMPVQHHQRDVSRKSVVFVSTTGGILLLALFLFLATSVFFPLPAHAELSQSDLYTVKNMVHDSEWQMRAMMESKLENVDARFENLKVRGSYPYNIGAWVLLGSLPFLANHMEDHKRESLDNVVSFFWMLQLLQMLFEHYYY